MAENQWIWQTTQETLWLTCSLLQHWPHAFGCSKNHPRGPQDLASYLELPSERASWARQVHGRDLIWAESQSIGSLQADAVASVTPSYSAWVCTADCVPILMAGISESGSPLVAAIHAGWRGTAAEITVHTLKHLQNKGLDLGSLRVAVGPAISGAVYQVSQDVVSQVIQTLPSSLQAKVLLADPEPDKTRLNLPETNKLQLITCGVSEEQISISPFCTWTDSEHFFSYRRLGSQLKDTEGRTRLQWSGIGIPSFLGL